MTGPWYLIRQFRAGLVALAILVFVCVGSTVVLAKDTPDGPDTPVSSDAGAPASSAEDPRASDGPGSAANVAPSAGAAAEIGSQVQKDAISHKQEEKDRMFVDATFIAVALVLCVIAFFLFMSLPKQPKKAGSDNQ